MKRAGCVPPQSLRPPRMRAQYQAGLIQYTRGQITITNREGLEAAACSCYRVIKDEYDRLLKDELVPDRKPRPAAVTG